MDVDTPGNRPGAFFPELSFHTTWFAARTPTVEQLEKAISKLQHDYEHNQSQAGREQAGPIIDAMQADLPKLRAYYAANEPSPMPEPEPPEPADPVADTRKQIRICWGRVKDLETKVSRKQSKLDEARRQVELAESEVAMAEQELSEVQAKEHQLIQKLGKLEGRPPPAQQIPEEAIIQYNNMEAQLAQVQAQLASHDLLLQNAFAALCPDARMAFNQAIEQARAGTQPQQPQQASSSNGGNPPSNQVSFNQFLGQNNTQFDVVKKSIREAVKPKETQNQSQIRKTNAGTKSKSGEPPTANNSKQQEVEQALTKIGATKEEIKIAMDRDDDEHRDL